MNKKKLSIVDLKLLKDFFQFRLNLWIMVSSTILLICIFIYFKSIKDFYVFPGNNNLKFVFYNDSANGGQSKILSQIISDSAICLEYSLNKGFLSPYVGISISPKNAASIDLSLYNQLKINAQGYDVTNIGISLFSINPYYKNTSNFRDLNFNKDLEISTERKEYLIDIEELRIPDWCRTINNIPPGEKIEPKLQSVLNLNIGTAYTPILKPKSSLIINSISLGRTNKKLFILLVSIELLIFLLLVIFHYFKAYSRKETVKLTIEYKPVDIENENRQSEGFLNYINNNFSDANLNLDQVANYAGIHQRRIASSIQENFGCNFKTYVNQLRINESKRLLKETELNMGEIAYKVGFNNQSHFNRVFKSLTGINPSEFRENK